MSQQQFEVNSEAVEDIPVLIAKLGRMKVLELAEQQFVPHGNWGGLGVGC